MPMYAITYYTQTKTVYVHVYIVTGKQIGRAHV